MVSVNEGGMRRLDGITRGTRQQVEIIFEYCLHYPGRSLVLFLAIISSLSLAAFLIFVRPNPLIAYGDYKEQRLLSAKVEMPNDAKRETADLKDNLDSQALDQPIRLAVPKNEFAGAPEVSIESMAGEVDTRIKTAVTESGDDYVFSLEQPNLAKHPGRFKLIARDLATQQIIASQDYAWGVLAFNPDYSIYPVNTQADLAMAVLDDEGRMVCDATLVLKITDPKGKTSYLGTADGSIKINDDCFQRGTNIHPDYQASYQVKSAGQYKVELTAKTANGQRHLIDRFEAQKEPSFTVRRIGATRIWPKAPYTNQLEITAKNSGRYTIEESLPKSFTIDQTEASLTLVDQNQVLSWEKDLQAGQKVTISYRYDAPDLSPYLYLAGPLKITGQKVDWQEGRSWQIASDNPGVINIIGYESNHTAANQEIYSNSGTIAIQSTTKRTGGYALQSNPTTTNIGRTFYRAPGSTGVTTGTYSAATLYARFYFRAGLLPADSTSEEIASANDTGTANKLVLRINTAGNILVYDNGASGGTLVATGTTALSLDTWYRIELKVGTAASNAPYEVKIDGKVEMTGTGSFGSSNNGEFRLGKIANRNGKGVNFYYDDVVYGDAGYPGPGGVELMQADSNGTYTAWTGSCTDLDENPPANYTEKITSATVGQKESCNFESASNAGISGTVNSMRSWIRASRDSSASADGALIIFVRSSSTEVATSSAATTSSSQDFSQVFDYDPATGTSWTTGGLDSIEVGVNNNDTDMTMAAAFYIFVDFYASPTADYLNITGFESGDISEAYTVNGSNLIQGSTVRTGSYALQTNPTTTNAEYFELRRPASDGNDAMLDVTTLFTRFYFRYATKPNSGSEEILAIYNASGSGSNKFDVRIDSDGKLSAWNQAGTTQLGSTGSTVLSSGTWYRIEVKTSTATGTNDAYEIKINGTSELSGAGDLTEVANGAVRLGKVTDQNHQTVDFFYDDVALTQGNYAGHGAVEVMQADGNGNYTAWGAGTTGTYTDVDEIPHDSDTTYSTSSTSGQAETVTLESAKSASIGGTINAVKAAAVIRDEGGSSAIQVRMRSGSTDIDTTSNDPTTSYSLRSLIRSKDPSDGNAWTSSDLDSLEVGVDNAASVASRVTALFAFVDFTGVKVSGTIYSDEGSTAYNCSGDNLTIGAAIAGGTTVTNTCTAAGGTYDIVLSQPAVADPIAVWIDSGETPKATAVTLATDTTSNITDLHLYQNRLILRHENAGPITNAKLATADNTDAGIRYSVASSNLTVESGIELHVWTGKTYTAGGTVTTNVTGGDFHVDDSATATLDTSSNALNKDVAVDTGATLTLNSTTSIVGDTTVTGTLGGTGALTVNGSLTGSGTVTMTSGATEQRVSASKNFGTTSGSNNWSFVNLTFSNSHASSPITITTQTGGSGTITASGILKVGASGDASGATTTLDAGNRTWTLSGTGGDPFQLLASPAGNLTPNASTFSYTGANGSGNTTIQSETYYNLTLNASDTFVLELATATSNDLTITTGTLDTVSGQNYGLTIGGNYSNSGTFTARSGTVTFNATDAGNTLSGTLSGGSAFYNLIFSGSGGDWTPSATLAVSNDLTMTAGSLLGSSNVSVAGGDVTGDGTITLTGGTFTLTGTGSFGGATAWTFNILTIGSTAVNTSTTTTGVGGITVSATMGFSADFDSTTVLDAGSKTWTLSGTTGTPLGSCGASALGVTFTANTSTFKYTGNAAGNTSIRQFTYYNLLLDNPSETYVNCSGTTTINNDLTITNGTLDASVNAGDLSIKGNYSNAGTFEAGTRTVTMAATTTGHTLSGTMTGSSAFYNLTFNGSGGAWSFGSNSATVDHTFTITNGTVTAPSTTLTVSLNFAQNGTFTHNSGTVLLNGTAQQTVSGTLTGSSAFNALTITNSTGADASDCERTSFTPSVIFSASATTAGTYTITTASVRIQYLSGGTYTFNNINWNGQAGGTPIYFRSSVADSGTWLLNVTAVGNAQTKVSYVNVSRSDASSGAQIVASDGTNVDCGNNTNWMFDESLTMSLDSTSVNFATITPGGSTTDATTTLTCTTNSNNGYVVYAWATQLLTDSRSGSTIANWTGSNASPTTFSDGTDSYFGYSTDDTDLSGTGGTSRFSGPKFAAFVNAGYGDPVADRTSPASSATNTITYRVDASSTQTAGDYQTTIVYIIAAQFP